MENFNENREYCKRIAEELKAIYNGHGVTEDGEQATLYDWINDALDFEYIIDSKRRYKSAKIWVTLGGPNVWIDTAEKSVKLAWANERAEFLLPYEVCDEIDEIMSEIWGMC